MTHGYENDKFQRFRAADQREAANAAARQAAHDQEFAKALAARETAVEAYDKSNRAAAKGRARVIEKAGAGDLSGALDAYRDYARDAATARRLYGRMESTRVPILRGHASTTVCQQKPERIPFDALMQEARGRYWWMREAAADE